MIDFTLDKCWPPLADQDRIQACRRYQLLFKGKHKDAFERRSARIPKGKRGIVYVSANYAGLMSRTTADLLVGQKPTFKVGEPGSPEQKALDKIVADNNVVQQLHEGAQSHSYNGGCVLSSRWGPRRPGKDPEVIFELKPVYTYFAERNPDNCRNILSEALAWERTQPDGSRILRVEHHLVGEIRQQAFKLGVGEYELPKGPRTEVRFYEKVVEELDALAYVPEVESQTRIPESLLVYIPNSRAEDEYYGPSDYADADSLFDAINGRLTKLKGLLDKHADPKLVGPKRVVGPGGVVRSEDLQYIEVDKDLGNIPRYLIWADGGLLDGCFKDLQELLQTLGRVTEMTPLFGNDKTQSIESAKALRLRFTPTLAKVNRKRLYWDAGAAKALQVALMLQEAMKPGSVGIAVEDVPLPVISWHDGLPQDPMEQTQIAVLQVNNRLAARRSLIRDLKGGTDEDAQREMDLIKEEQEAAAPPAAPPGPLLPPGVEGSGGPPVAPPPVGAANGAL